MIFDFVIFRVFVMTGLKISRNRKSSFCYNSDFVIVFVIVFVTEFYSSPMLIIALHIKTRATADITDAITRPATAPR